MLETCVGDGERTAHYDGREDDDYQEYRSEVREGNDSDECHAEGTPSILRSESQTYQKKSTYILWQSVVETSSVFGEAVDDAAEGVRVEEDDGRVGDPL